MNITADQRKALLAQYISGSVMQGWRVQSQGEFNVVLFSSNKPNHVLHLLLTIFTCFLWGIVWALLAATGRDDRRTVFVDEHGNVIVNSS